MGRKDTSTFPKDGEKILQWLFYEITAGCTGNLVKHSGMSEHIHGWTSEAVRRVKQIALLSVGGLTYLLKVWMNEKAE